MSQIDAASAEEVAAATQRRRSLFLRICLGCIPRSPKSADGLTNWLVTIALIGVPAWFVGSYYYGQHEPSVGFIWAAPWIVAYPLWFAIQMLCLSVSSQKKPEDITYWEIFYSMAAPTACFVTAALFILLWYQGKYHFGYFQWNSMLAFFSATLLNAAIGGSVRFALKGRYFGNLSGNN